MRLIDLDQTIFVPIVDESKGGIEYEMEMTIGEMFDRFLDGFQPEMVDAVPVEWIKALTNHSDMFTRGAAKWVMGCWKKEQEGR